MVIILSYANKFRSSKLKEQEQRVMKIIVIGAGFTGTQLTRRLIVEGNDVVLIDNDEETVRHVSNRLDCMVLHASGNSLAILEEAGLSKTDAVVAVTNSDELNMITCSLVNSVQPHIIKIARVRNYDYYHNSEQTNQRIYGIDFMVHPDVEAANEIVTAVEHGAITDVVRFENSDFELTSIYIEKGSNLAEMTVQDMRKITVTPFLLAFVEKDGNSFFPSGSTILAVGDRIGIIIHKGNLSEFLGLCGSKIDVLKKIALVGAGKIGTSIADQLIKNNSNPFRLLFGMQKKVTQGFVIIDSDSVRAKAASERFPSANVYCADITDESFIEEEDLSSFDLVISATRNHELNMVASAYMKTLGVSKSVCLVQSGNYAAIARNIGIDVAVPIKDAVIDSILSHLRGKSVTGIHTVAEGRLEIIEIFLPKTSPAIGEKLRTFSNYESFILLLIKKEGTEEFIIPSGNTEFEAGDRLVILVYIEKAKHTMATFGVGS